MFQPAIPVFGMVLPPLIWQRDFFALNPRSATGSLQDLEQCPAPQVRRSWLGNAYTLLTRMQTAEPLHSWMPGCFCIESGSNCSNRASSFDTDHTTLIYRPSLFGETCLSMKMTSRSSSLISAITSKQGQVSSYICVASITLIISTIANSNEFFLHTCAKSPCARNPLRRSCLGSFFVDNVTTPPHEAVAPGFGTLLAKIDYSGLVRSSLVIWILLFDALHIPLRFVRLFKPWRLIMNR